MCGLGILFSSETYLRGYLIWSGPPNSERVSDPKFFELLVWPDQPGILKELFVKAQKIKDLRAKRRARYDIVAEVAGYPNQLRKLVRILNANYLAAKNAA